MTSIEHRVIRKILSKTEQPLDEELTSLLDIAERYPLFPDIAQVFQQGEKLLYTIEKKPQETESIPERMQSLFEQLRRAVGVLELSLENQATYGLADKRWMRDTKSLDEALQRGRLVMELDIRQDKEGNFWVSHAAGAKASMLPPYIHDLSTEEMGKSKRFPLRDGLEALKKYKEKGHQFILELKTLGDDDSKREEQVKKLQAMLRETGTEGSIAIASLSPGILMEVNKVMPEVPLILNGGIVPGFSYTKRGEKIASALPEDKRWHAVGIPHVGEVVVSASEESVVRPDGHGTQTGYVLTTLPTDLLEVLQKQAQQPEKYGRFGGVVSLSAVMILANVLETFGAKETAKEMVEYYVKILEESGVNIMATTWGQGLGRIPGLKRLKPMEQLRVFKERLGADVTYTKAPEEWAHLLPKEIIEFVQMRQRPGKKPSVTVEE